MTSFVQLGLAAIAALTALTATAIVMGAKERMHTRRQDDYVAMQREGLEYGRRQNRDVLRTLTDRSE